MCLRRYASTAIYNARMPVSRPRTSVAYGRQLSSSLWSRRSARNTVEQSVRNIGYFEEIFRAIWSGLTGSLISSTSLAAGPA